VENIDDQFRKLRLALKERSGFSSMLQNAQACAAVQSFQQCWSHMGAQFNWAWPISYW
jgi:hypothetical protein